MNEIVITQKAGALSCDIEGIRSQIEAYVKQYEGVVFTEETKADAKKTVAEIRKSRTAFEKVIKEAKEKYMIPWMELMAQLNEMFPLYDKAIAQINEQITAFEESRKEEKEARIKEIFGEMVFEDDILAFLPLSRVYNEKWLNATYTEKQIKDDIMTAKMNVKTSVQSIKAMQSDVEDKALEVFKETLNLPEALKVITDYEANKRVFKQKVETETRAEVVDSFIPVEGGESKGYTYTIFLTPDAKQKLEMFMDSIGIEYFERR